MSEHAHPDPDETPEDVASLYSWANLHGAKYRDFSASRAQMREKARQRIEQTNEEGRLPAQQLAEPQRPAENPLAQEEPQPMTPAAQQPTHLAAQEAAPPAARQAEAAPPTQARLQEDASSPPRSPWLLTDPRDHAGRPAWLLPEPPESFGQPVPPPSSEDTLQDSRDRLISRWYALRSLFEDNEPAQSAPPSRAAGAPVLAVFSLAGGAGKTSLVATLGRVLSARSERVLLVDTAAYGLLPFFFGARDQRPGLLRTFSPPMASGDAPIQMITLDRETLGPKPAAAEKLTAEIQKYARGVSRVIVDLATASGAIMRRVMRLAPQILVPLLPDMGSVVSVSSIDAFFEYDSGAVGEPALPYYVLNQFDPSLPLHLDIREVLRDQLGERLLPFAMRHNPAVSEALAEGMTVVDYAPNSALTEDYLSLAGWLKSLSAPASASFRGERWSEQ